ncbi:MAG: hypothetical protein NTZ79_13575, partial [Proteobacteria bacterium]|nr:hypothetical protein [Pseudomonadota bacterium]
MEQQSGWTVCVYCASSGSCDPVYHEAASLLGESLAAAGFTASAVAARLTPGPLPQLEAEMAGRLMGGPIAVA